MKPTYFENFNIKQIKAYTETAVLNAYKQIAEDLQIEYDFPQGGCQQRAHLASLLLEKTHKIQHVKIWLFAPATLSALNTTMLEIKDKNMFTQGNKIGWGYHVAPVVKIKKNNITQLLVIDPALSNRPISLTTWFNAITNSAAGSFTYTTSQTYFFNCFLKNDGCLSTVFDGTFYEYDKDNRQNLELEKGLTTCSTAMYIFNNHIKAMQQIQKGKKKTEDLKAIFGNATAIDALVAQNSSANTPNTMARYALTHYAGILNEAKTFFNDKLAYWVKFTNLLLKEK